MKLDSQYVQAAEISDHQAQVARHAMLERRCERLLSFEEAMFQWRSRHLILVLTLGYREEFRNEVTLADLQRDRDRLLNNLRSNPVLMGISGYIWLMEYGENHGGFHLHFLVFYDGTKRSDILIAEEIGEYWKEVVTRGDGAYRNSNRDKARYERGAWGDATGQIDRNNFPKRESLRTYMKKYLCKDDQALKDAHPHIRTFGISQFPTA